jgi:drug/metabolite transporter (DMT)-like permease
VAASGPVGAARRWRKSVHDGQARCLPAWPGRTPTGEEGAVSRRGWVLFATMSVIWGIPYLLIKVAVAGVPVPVLVLARVAVGAALLLPLAVRRGQLRVLLPHWRWLAVFAVVEIVSPWFLLSEAERRLSSSMSGLLIASVPIIGALLARLTGDAERLTLIRWAGLLGGLAGVALLVGPGAAGGDARSIGEVLLVGLCYAAGPLIASRKLAGVPPIGMTAACLGLAAVIYAPAAALTWPAALPSAKVLAALLTLAAVCTAAAFLLFFALIAEVGPARATVITYVNPAVAVALGVMILGEQFTPLMAGAFALILGGSVLATASGLRRRAADRALGAAAAGIEAARPAAAQAAPGASAAC